MNIGIDYDYTITENPEFFRSFTKSLAESGNEVYIISSFTKADEPFVEEIIAAKVHQLDEWEIDYKKLEMAPEPIPPNKARLCRKYKISVMIDDDARNLMEIMRSEEGVVCLQFMPKSD